jgi:hypothetical protein
MFNALDATPRHNYCATSNSILIRNGFRFFVIDDPKLKAVTQRDDGDAISVGKHSSK